MLGYVEEVRRRRVWPSSSEQSSDTLTTGSGHVKCGETNDSDDDGVAATATDDMADGDDCAAEDAADELVDPGANRGAGGGLPVMGEGWLDWPCVGE